MSADERLRVLFVAPFPPRLAGTHGGAKVVGQLLARTSERHATALVYLRHPDEPDLDDELRNRLEFAEAIDRPHAGRMSLSHWVRAARWRAAVVTGRPRAVTELTLPTATSRLRELAAAWKPDVVRLEYPVAGAYLPALAGSPAVRLLADYDALLESGRSARLDLRAWRRFRRTLLGEVDAVVVPTERDRAVLARLGTSTEIVRIPFGADVDAPELDPTGKDDVSLIFVGNLNHEPNRDAARFLAAEVLPRVRRDHPGTALRLVGERTEELAGLDGVEAAGRVPDVTPHLDAAAVVVAPVRIGAGMRVKVVDALVAGKAVVATPLAIEGLDVEPGRQLVVAEPGDFAKEISSLLADRGRRAELGRNAREWAVANLGWDQALDAYDALYARLVSRGGRTRS